jgi:hypothetical protein
MTTTATFSRALKVVGIVFLASRIAHEQQCQITSPLPIPITIQGCTYNSNLPGGSTSYIQNASSLQIGATGYPDFLYVGSSATIPALSVPTLTSGDCVQAGTNGLLTSASGACGSGSGGGSSVYPATSTASFPFGLSASTVTVSTMTIGSVMLESSFDNTGGNPANTLLIMPLVDNSKSIRFLFSDTLNAMSFDSQNDRIGFFTTTPSKKFYVNDNIVSAGQLIGQSGLAVPTGDGSFSFQGKVTLASGSAVVTNAIVDSTFLIYLTIQSPSGTVGSVYVSSVTANTTFNILSTSNADNSTVAWLMVGSND